MENKITARGEITGNNEMPFTVEVLSNPADRQLFKLENDIQKVHRRGTADRGKAETASACN